MTLISKARHIISKRILVQKVGATNKTLKISRLGCILSCNQAVFSTKADLTKNVVENEITNKYNQPEKANDAAIV